MKAPQISMSPPQVSSRILRLVVPRVRLVVLSVRLVALTLLVSVCSAGMLLSEELSRFERERARMMLKIVKGDVDKFYYDPAYRGINLDAVFAAAGGKIDQAASMGQCLAAIARPLLEFKDSHTFFPPPSRAARLEYGWRMQMVGDRCFITAVQDGTDAAAKGLKRRDAILAIDGFKPTRDNLWGILYVYRALAPRSTVLGDRSSGSVMMSRVYDHGIGDSTQIFFATSVTVADIIMKDGKSVECIGVAPDEVILPTPEDLAAGRDPALSRAASLCGVTLDPGKAGSLFPVEWEK